MKALVSDPPKSPLHLPVALAIVAGTHNRRCTLCRQFFSWVACALTGAAARTHPVETGRTLLQVVEISASKCDVVNNNVVKDFICGNSRKPTAACCVSLSSLGHLVPVCTVCSVGTT